MGLEQLSSREAVLEAMRLYDERGRELFLKDSGFSTSKRYVLVYDGRDYDSKAIAGVAYGIQFPAEAPRTPANINGGVGNAGAATVLRRLGFVVNDSHGTITRAAGSAPSATRQGTPARPAMVAAPRSSRADFLLIGCVKEKLGAAAPARLLYTSDLFKKRRAYAERTGLPWFILSALHGLVGPDSAIEPYDMALKEQPASYRRSWGAKVVADLVESGLVTADSVVEVHAGAAYVDSVSPGLSALGVQVVQPLSGLRFGQQLAWYLHQREMPSDAQAYGVPVASAPVADYLGESANAQPCGDFPWGRSDLEAPGLYSWWIDDAGAAAMTRGLGQSVAPGLVYAGLAGATSAGRSSVSSTLRSRIAGNHLRGGIHGSTWRKSLTAMLLDQLDLDVSSGDLAPSSQAELTDWMRRHLMLAVYPIADSRGVGAAEDALLERLDPPLNLDGMGETPVRAALRGLRRELPRRR
jgi:hypothetical protein